MRPCFFDEIFLVIRFMGVSGHYVRTNICRDRRPRLSVTDKIDCTNNTETTYQSLAVLFDKKRAFARTVEDACPYRIGWRNIEPRFMICT